MNTNESLPLDRIVCSGQPCRLRCGERFVRSWSPSTEIRASPQDQIVLGLVHGLGDHSGRYDEMGRWFASRGMHVYAFDLMGHGKSSGGRMAIPNYEALILDVESFFEYVKQQNAGSRYGLFGQSMGGNLVLNHQLRGYSQPAFVIAGSPMLRAVEQPGRISMSLLRAFSYLLPNFKLRGNVDPSCLSRDPRMQRAFNEDPLVQRGVTLRLGRVLIDSGDWALKHADQLPTQTLITHGSDDQITCHRASQEFTQRASGKAVAKIWSGGKHDLHHDIVKDEYFSMLFDWIQDVGSV